MIRTLPFLLGLLVLVVGAVPAAGGGKCSTSTKCYRTTTLDARNTVDGNLELKGPTCLEVTDVNPLRYRVSFSEKIVDGTAPDLFKVPVGFKLPAVKKTAEKTADQDPQTIVGFRGPDDTSGVEDQFAAALSELERLETAVASSRQKAYAAHAAVEQALARVQALVESSDDYPASARTTAIEDILDEWPQEKWPACSQIDDEAQRVAALREQLEDLQKPAAAFVLWSQGPGNEARYAAALDGVKQLETVLDAIECGGENHEKFEELSAQLRRWKHILKAAGAEETTRTHCIPCGFPFLTPKEHTVFLVLEDRLAKPGTAARQVQLVKVTCPSRFSISTGIGWSGLDERDFAFVQSLRPPEATPADDPTAQQAGEGEEEATESQVIKVFGLQNEADHSVDPAALINVRLTDWNLYNLYATAGTVLDFDDPDSSVRFGYFAGLSLSLSDHFVISAGVKVARLPTLAGGFELGDPVPEGVTEPPLTREWDEDYSVIFSYKFQ